MDTLAERAKVGDLLFFQSDESENITNIAFYLGKFCVTFSKFSMFLIPIKFFESSGFGYK